MSDENKDARPFVSDRAWTAMTYLALIGGVLGIVAMLGCQQFTYDAPTKQQIVQFVGSIATTAAGYALRHSLAADEDAAKGKSL